ncbi:hypothetical protein AtEden1_Chr1g0079381 [Arabidopsis thaliana]
MANSLEVPIVEYIRVGGYSYLRNAKTSESETCHQIFLEQVEFVLSSPTKYRESRFKTRVNKV